MCTAAEKDRQSAAANVLEERMALFTGRSNRRGDGKKKAVARRTWTVSFVCVADRYQARIPSSTDKQVSSMLVSGSKSSLTWKTTNIMF